MKYVTPDEMRQIDYITQENVGIPGIVLMENAGRSVAEAVINTCKKGRVVVVCGRGNNGGDGFVCARHLINNGFEVEIFLIGEPEKLAKNAMINYNILGKMGADIKLLAYQSIEFFKEELSFASCIVDAIFGIGISREIEDPYKTIIDIINICGKCVISVDVPSGLDAASGNVLGTCIKASKTVTFAYPKKGFIRKSGPRQVGELVVADISIPKHIFRD